MAELGIKTEKKFLIFGVDYFCLNYFYFNFSRFEIKTRKRLVNIIFGK
jgi:hypothetical protein